MATFTATINENINVFGMEPTNTWGSFQWGQLWAFSNQDLETNFFDGGDDETVTLTDEIVLKVFLVQSESINATDSGVDELHLKDSAGYSYIFTKPTDDIEDADQTIYTATSEPSTSYSESSSNNTSWSES